MCGDFCYNEPTMKTLTKLLAVAVVVGGIFAGQAYRASLPVVYDKVLAKAELAAK